MKKILSTLFFTASTLFADSLPQQLELSTEKKETVVQPVDFKKAFAENDVETVKAFLEQNKFTAKATFGEERTTFLMTAVHEGKTDIARLLIENGANVNATTTVEQPGMDGETSRDLSGITPLMLAVLNRDAKTVKMLLENGADKTVQNEIGDTALDIAISTENKDVITAFETKAVLKTKAPQP